MKRASTPAPFPPPGQLIDLGGWRLHLNCTGEASASQPTVILEAGVGDFSVEWSLKKGRTMLQRAIWAHVLTSRHGVSLMVERDR